MAHPGRRAPIGRWLLPMLILCLLGATAYLIADGLARRPVVPIPADPSTRPVSRQVASTPGKVANGWRNPSAAPSNAGSEPSDFDDDPEETDPALDRRSPPEIAGIRTLHALPATEAEVAAAYNAAHGNICEVIPAGQPFEIGEFTPFLTAIDRISTGGARPVPSLRRHALSVGLEISVEEQSRLPQLSGSQILEYVDGHFVTIQVRVRRDPVTGRRYLHHRPLAATATFDGLRLTQEPTEAVVGAIRDFRGLGLLVGPEGASSVEDLRTLVLVHRHALPGTEGGADQVRARMNYEYVVVRARPGTEGTGDPLELHTFCTTQQRDRWHYLRPADRPSGPARCSVRANVRFTEYSHGVYPTASVIEGTAVLEQGTFTADQLNRFAESQGWSGGVLRNLPAILDAIIDRRLAPSPASR